MSATLQRVVVVAENCSRRMGGEAILPFHYFRLLRARGLDAHLVVHERVREELLELFPHDTDKLHFVSDRALQKLFFRFGKVLPHRVQEATFGLASQLITQLAQRALVRRLAAPGSVLHQPIPVSPRFPSLMYGVGMPVVVGPMNGDMRFPPAFQNSESTFSHLALRFGRSLADAGNRLFPGKLEASAVLVANSRTHSALPGPVHGRVLEMVENGVDTQQWQPTSNDAGTDPHRFLFIGRLVDWKALDIVLEALAVTPEATLDVIGDGPMHGTWRGLSERLGLGGRVHFLGWRTQAECAIHLQKCVALVLPSLYECGGAVVLEAMAMSRPVVATAWGGPADYLDEECGILIEPKDRRQLIDGFANAMRNLLAAPELASSLGRAGRLRLLANFDWDRKIERMLDIYRSTLA